jgi:hypothetical protein
MLACFRDCEHATSSEDYPVVGMPYGYRTVSAMVANRETDCTVDTTHVGTTQVGIAQVGTAQVGIAQVGTTQVGTA